MTAKVKKIPCPRAADPGATCKGRVFYPGQLAAHQSMAHASIDGEKAPAAVGCTACDANRRRASSLEKKVADLAGELEKAKATPAPTAPESSTAIPALSAVLEHCESGTCENHAAELASLKESVITATLSNREAVKVAAEALGLVPKAIKVELVPAGTRG